MPGVPSGRACENCRRRRQKCDYLKPTCSRCARLGVECVGSGQQRFVFIDQKCARRQNGSRTSDDSVTSTPYSSLRSLSPCPISQADILTSSFVDMVKPSTDCRFNLVWTYGEFLNNIPQRLGYSIALDAAAQALVASHRDFSIRRPVTPDSLTKYSSAIKALTKSIGDPTTSYSTETVCAVILLTMCQNLSGMGLEHLNSHCHGAVHMLHARRANNIVEDFELDLHTYLLGPVLVQSLFNSTMRLSPPKFKVLTRVLAIDENSPRGSFLVRLFEIPALLQRGRSVLHGEADREAFIADLYSTYRHIHAAKLFLYQKFMTIPEPQSKQTGPYGFCLAFGCIFNCMLRGMEPTNAQLLSEAESLVKDTFDLIPETQKNRPLGGAHMMLNFSAAWLCAKDEHERQMLHALLGDYSWDFRRTIPENMWRVEDLEEMLRDLQFQTDPEVLLACAA